MEKRGRAGRGKGGAEGTSLYMKKYILKNNDFDIFFEQFSD